MNLEPIGAKRVELVRHSSLLGEKRRAGAASHSSRETTFGGNKVLVAMIIFPLIAGLSWAPGRAARLVVS